MDEEEKNKNDFEAYFNPEDISHWLTVSPKAFFAIMANGVALEITYIRLIADILRQHPDAGPAIGKMSFNDLMVDIISRTDRIQRMLMTGSVYMENYDK